MLSHLLPFMSIHLALPALAVAEASRKSARMPVKAIALGVGAGGGAAGAGAGIGMLFGNVIEPVTRQPEMRDEIELDPVARLRAHRGHLLLRLGRRLHRLLPIGRC